MPPMLTRKRRPDGRRVLTSAMLFAALAAVACAAQATPKWAISRPLPEGRQSPLAAAPLQKKVAEEKAQAERDPIPLERIDVEGFRDPDARREPPRTAEQRFADVLNAGSPELIAGRSYNGYYYDGTLFWASDPLSFAWKNVTHWLTR